MNSVENKKVDNVKSTAEIKAIVTLSDGRVIEAQFLAEGSATCNIENQFFDYGMLEMVDADVENIQPLASNEFLEDGIENDMPDLHIVQIIKVVKNITEWSFDISALKKITSSPPRGGLFVAKIFCNSSM